MPTPVLTPLQARVLGVLYEKQQTVPDTYPMTLNALRAGCNQKTSRDPLMSVSEGDVVGALDALRGLSLVIESSGGRAMRYEQNIRRVIDLPGASVALLTTLVLRGPQTAAELRLNSERLYRFADTSSVEAFLNEMASRADGPLAIELARRPGERERRWAQLLTGPVADDAPAIARGDGAARTAGTMAATDPAELAAGLARDDRLAALEARVAALEQSLRALQERPAGGAPADEPVTDRD